MKWRRALAAPFFLPAELRAAESSSHIEPRRHTNRGASPARSERKIQGHIQVAEGLRYASGERELHAGPRDRRPQRAFQSVLLPRADQPTQARQNATLLHAA